MSEASRKAETCLERARSQGSRPGLERVSELLKRLGHPENRKPPIQTAGTNGKGSTCAFLESILMQAGFHTGMFISPWLSTPAEMFRIDGRPISEERLSLLLAETADAAEGMERLVCGYPTEFEVHAAAASLLFEQEGCTAVLLETGMGGLLDATNTASQNALAIITRISLEHEQWLGHSLSEIAGHKAGILRPGGKAVVWPLAEEAMCVVRETAVRLGTALHSPEPDRILVHSMTPTAMSFDAAGFDSLTSRLIGRHQAENAAMAISAALQLRESGWRIGDADIRRGIAAARWPCRFEVFDGPAPFVLDSAHNPDGVRTFVETFREVFPGRRLHLVFGAMRDKDVSAMLAAVAPLTDRLIAVRPSNSRAMDASELANRAKPACERVEKSDTIEQAVRMCLSDLHQDAVCAAIGSIYYMGEIRGCLMKLGMMAPV